MQYWKKHEFPSWYVGPVGHADMSIEYIPKCSAKQVYEISCWAWSNRDVFWSGSFLGKSKKASKISLKIGILRYDWYDIICTILYNEQCASQKFQGCNKNGLLVVVQHTSFSQMLLVPMKSTLWPLRASKWSPHLAQFLSGHQNGAIGETEKKTQHMRPQVLKFASCSKAFVLRVGPLKFPFVFQLLSPL